MATYSRTRLAQTAVQFMDKYPVKTIVQALALELKNAHKERELDLLVQDISHELWHTHRHLAASLITARPLSKTMIKALTKLLKDHYQAKTIEITQTVTPALIGGLIVKTPLGELDTSLLNQLNQLKTKML